MNWIRDFSTQEGHIPISRTIEDAPFPMRQELLDAIYLVAEHSSGKISVDGELYFLISQCLGVQAAANPMGGRRQRMGRDIGAADWFRVYDLIVRLWVEFARIGFQDPYREQVNRLLAAHAVAWDLGNDGHLHRVLHAAALAQVNAAFTELSDFRYAAALALFKNAGDAYDDRPRRNRDACTNIFDSMESVAKEKYGMPNATFGQVVSHIRQIHALNDQVVGVLDAINTLRNKNFGHGMTAPFSLQPAEVDFIYLACIGAILLVARTP